ncbi:MAG: DUF1127 domain-containing protein [Rhodobacter sp.]|nr:DUF1127 domain-containing protein [Rhodobacter sp.]
MASTTALHGFETGIIARIRASVHRARINNEKRRDFNRTYAELSKLTNRELDDLGIGRANIADVARSAAYGN